MFLPSENEWYKGAFYNPATSSYFRYPTFSNSAPVASLPTSVPNSANYDHVSSQFTDVGAYSGTKSPYGAFDMGGNMWQWNESMYGPDSYQRGIRGGTFISNAQDLSSSGSNRLGNTYYNDGVGFRLASIANIPEPSSFVLAAFGLAGLLAWGWRRRKRLGPS